MLTIAGCYLPKKEKEKQKYQKGQKQNNPDTGK
jgi:hypothetical protein